MLFSPAHCQAVSPHPCRCTPCQRWCACRRSLQQPSQGTCQRAGRHVAAGWRRRAMAVCHRLPPATAAKRESLAGMCSHLQMCHIVKHTHGARNRNGMGCRVDSHGAGPVVMKNWLPLVFGPAFAMLSTPAPVCFNSRVSSSSNFSPCSSSGRCSLSVSGGIVERSYSIASRRALARR